MLSHLPQIPFHVGYSMFRNSYSDVVRGARRAPDGRRKSSTPKAAAALAWEPSPASPSPTHHPSARPPLPKPSAFPALNAGIEINDERSNVCKPLVSMSRSWAAATKGTYSRHSFPSCQQRRPDKHSQILLNLPSHNSSHCGDRNTDVYSQKPQAHQNLQTWLATTKSLPPKRQNIWRPLPEADRLRTSEGLQRSPVTAPFHFFLHL